MASWNRRRIAYFGALIFDIPMLFLWPSIFGTLILILWLAASRTRPIKAWIDAGEPG